MNYKKYKAASCFALLVITSVGQVSCHPNKRHEHYTQTKSYHTGIRQEIVWPVLGFFGAITGIFALGQWLGWWSESDEQLMQRLNKQQELLKNYEPMLHYVHEATARYDMGFEESRLYEMALCKREMASIESYIRTLTDAIKQAEQLISDLYKRSSKLKREHEWHEVQDLCVSFDLGAQAVQANSDKLKALLSYLKTHASYFKLFEQEDYARSKYGQPLHISEQYPEYALFRELRAWIMSRYTGTFGLLDFVRALKTDSAKLEHAVQHPAYNYAVRIGYARELLNRLYYVQKILVADPEYTRLLAEYDRAQREKERLQIERERLQAEERKAYAREREAAAKEREARAQEEKNRLKYIELAEQKRYREYH